MIYEWLYQEPKNDELNGNPIQVDSAKYMLHVYI